MQVLVLLCDLVTALCEELVFLCEHRAFSVGFLPYKGCGAVFEIRSYVAFLFLAHRNAT